MSRFRDRLVKLEAAARDKGRGAVEVVRHIVHGGAEELDAVRAAAIAAAPGAFHVFRVIVAAADATSVPPGASVRVQ